MSKDNYSELLKQGQQQINNQANTFNDNDEDEYFSTGYVEEALKEEDDEEIDYNLDDEEEDEEEQEDLSKYKPDHRPSDNDIKREKVKYRNDNPEEMPKVDLFDKAIFPGGPLASMIETWKRKWSDSGLRVLEIQDEFFIFRTLNRFEYKQIAGYNVDALSREEIICENCVLWPEEYDHKTLALEKAGIPSTLSQIIMEESGFTDKYSIDVL